MDSPSAAANPNNSNALRLAELAALVDAVKERVQTQYPETAPGGANGAVSVGLPDLTPLARARDAATGKMAAIGTVNPRPGGLVNNAIQSVKRAVSRALNWFVRDQVVFNRQMIAVVETCIETLADVNRTIHSLASQTNIQIAQVRLEAEPLRAEARTLRGQTTQLVDLASHWHRWREEWQLKLHRNEVEFLKSVADLNTLLQQKIMNIEAASQQRYAQAEAAFPQRILSLEHNMQEHAVARDAAFKKIAGELDARIEIAIVPLEASFRETLIQAEASFERKVAQMESDVAASLRTQHDDFENMANSNAVAMEQSTRAQVEALAAESRQSSAAIEQQLTTSINNLQKAFYGDLDRIRTEYERVIHAELRVVRQRLGTVTAVAPMTRPVENPTVLPFDYARFADRFRGPEQYVTESQRFYVPFFAGRRHVLDVGCGRGEFLKLMQEAGVLAKGIEASDESVAYCRSLGLDATTADLFTYLAAQPEGTLDGIFCSQVVEHLPPDRLPEMVRLCSSRLATGGILAIETPNPECLAIFGTHFYLDPTHTRPVPSQLLAFYMEEFGLGRIEVHRRAPAIESMREVGELPPGFREKFFDGLDYAILAYKL
jgi:2-polyprenyl-3-methyl-5-hydroxy-6-metoxy-1,4-benzoquinol methylase